VEITTEDGTAVQHAADVVVVALTSWDAAVLVEPLSATLAAALREIRYFPVAVAMAEYARPIFTEQVRALVFGPDSPLSNAGAYGIHDRHIVRYTFSGRAARPLLVDQPDTAALILQGETELNRHVAVPAQARRHTVGSVWQRGLCAYGPRHEDRLSRIDRESSRLSGVVLTGDYLQGASIEACFRAARAGTAAGKTPHASPSSDDRPRSLAERAGGTAGPRPSGVAGGGR
jgi:oxygen-dependent protoporphyrinogen oxidase